VQAITIRGVAVAKIQVRRRPEGYQDSLRRYGVVLDGNKVASVAKGESVTIETEPGDHEVHLKMDWARSRSVRISLADAQQVTVECWPRANPLLWPYWMTLGRSRYIGIEVLPNAATATPHG
jgi:hypothetical protein